MRQSLKLFTVTAAFALFCTAFAAPLQICKFKGGKKAAVSLTFDDGTLDHLVHALPLLKQYGFKGTFYIIVNRVPQQGKPSRQLNSILTWDELKLFLAEGHEIGNHSMTHRRQLTKEKSMEDSAIPAAPTLRKSNESSKNTIWTPPDGATPAADQNSHSNNGNGTWNEFLQKAKMPP